MACPQYSIRQKIKLYWKYITLQGICTIKELKCPFNQILGACCNFWIINWQYDRQHFWDKVARYQASPLLLRLAL